jgi:hypothetical protein
MAHNPRVPDMANPSRDERNEREKLIGQNNAATLSEFNLLLLVAGEIEIRRESGQKVDRSRVTVAPLQQ